MRGGGWGVGGQEYLVEEVKKVCSFKDEGDGL